MLSAYESSGSYKRGRSRSRSSRSARRRSITASRSSTRSILAGTANSYRSWPIGSGWNNMWVDPFPTRQRAVLRYSTNHTFNPTSVLPDTYIFRANSIFDPDYSGTGHQPYGHDQYQAIYKYYRVKKAIITVTSASTGGNNVLGVATRATTQPTNDIEGLREIKGTRYTPLAHSDNPIKLTLSHSPLGDDRSDQTAVFGNNPDDTQYFHVWCAPQGMSDPGQIAVCIDITYFVEMWEPLYLGTS